MSPHTLPASRNALCAAPAQPSSTAARTAADLLACVVAARDLDQQPLPPPAWLWQGYLGPGNEVCLGALPSCGAAPRLARAARGIRLVSFSHCISFYVTLLISGTPGGELE
jgi:hypothetical protein